jgi:hypothetical protein
MTPVYSTGMFADEGKTLDPSKHLIRPDGESDHDAFCEKSKTALNARRSHSLVNRHATTASASSPISAYTQREMDAPKPRRCLTVGRTQLLGDTTHPP